MAIDADNPLAAEIRQEIADAYFATCKKMVAALEALKTYDRAVASSIPDHKQITRRTELIEDAAERVWDQGGGSDGSFRSLVKTASASNLARMKPTVYLILFRGVGGKTQLPTQTLRKKLTEAGFENVATYINSGNAIVRSRMSGKRVIATIAELCRAQFGFDKAIFAPTLAEWDELIARNPFGKAAANAPTTVHAALLESAPRADDIARIRACAVKGEEIEVIGNVAYLHTPHGFGRSKMAEKFDKWIGVTNTAQLEHRPQAR